MSLWLSKPIYEVLPYCYMAGGLLLLAAALWLDSAFWRAVCPVLGIGLLGTGVLRWRRRREFRSRQ